LVLLMNHARSACLLLALSCRRLADSIWPPHHCHHW
jgi:hypothetical protein